MFTACAELHFAEDDSVSPADMKERFAMASLVGDYGLA